MKFLIFTKSCIVGGGEHFGQVMNPCPTHNNQEIEYMDKTERKGLCRDCVQSAVDLHHEILSVKDVKEDVNDLLVQLESNTMKMLAQKTEQISLNKK